MLKNYFNEFNKKQVKKTSSKKAASGKESKKAEKNIDTNRLIEVIRGFIPLNLEIDSFKPIDSSGFSPDGADFIIYRPYCRDMGKLLNGYIPYELIHGGIFSVDDLTKNSLADVLNRVAMLKKINKFTESENTFSIPSFIIAGTSKSYPLIELKNDVMNYYLSKGIEAESEFELFAVLNFGILIKDWHKGNRSFVALETGDDTFMWLAILMNEYLDIDREDEFDLRKYVRGEKVYTEF